MADAVQLRKRHMDAHDLSQALTHARARLPETEEALALAAIQSLQRNGWRAELLSIFPVIQNASLLLYLSASFSTGPE